MRIDHIRSLIALAETGSMTQAAEIMGLSQSAVTRNVQALEKAVGFALVDREHRPLKLTEQGEMIAAHGRRMLETVEAMTSAAPEYPAIEQAAVRIGFGPTAGMLLTRSVLSAAFRTHTPGRQVVVEHGRSLAMINGLLSGRLNIIVANGAEIRKFDEVQVLSSYLFRIGLYTRADHPLQDEPQLDFPDLAQYPITGPNASDEFNSMIAEALGGVFEVRSFQAIITEDVLALAEAATMADGVVAAAEPLVAPLVSRGLLKELSMTRPLNFPARVQIATSALSDLSAEDQEWIVQSASKQLLHLGAIRDA